MGMLGNGGAALPPGNGDDFLESWRLGGLLVLDEVFEEVLQADARGDLFRPGNPAVVPGLEPGLQFAGLVREGSPIDVSGLGWQGQVVAPVMDQVADPEPGAGSDDRPYLGARPEFLGGREAAVRMG
jgi:hypothetical protein